MCHKDHSDANVKSYIPQVEKDHSHRLKAVKNPGNFGFFKTQKSVEIVKKLWSNRRLRFWFIVSVIVFKVLLTLLMINLIPGLKNLPENFPV